MISKLKKLIGKVPFLKNAVAMCYCMLDSSTPAHIKAVIVPAITYLLLPTDAVPDFLPGVGYTDDAGVIATALATVRFFIKDEHWRKARDFFR